MIYLNRFILINALLLLLAAILHAQQPGFFECEAGMACHEMKLHADIGQIILAVVLFLTLIRAYRSNWTRQDLILLAVLAVAMLFAVVSYLNEPSMERYTTSFLIYVEILCLLGVFLSLASIVVWPILIFTRRWQEWRQNFYAIIFAVFCLVVAVYLDAPTLIFAT